MFDEPTAEAVPAVTAPASATPMEEHSAAGLALQRERDERNHTDALFALSPFFNLASSLGCVGVSMCRASCARVLLVYRACVCLSRAAFSYRRLHLAVLCRQVYVGEVFRVCVSVAHLARYELTGVGIKVSPSVPTAHTGLTQCPYPIALVHSRPSTLAVLPRMPFSCE